ncbi:unnamed protein product [Blepharisma stoltei]|uniref:Uncharacterized protein n=1 Tax=Blepharisma stoltei TaxID=1481888 RepID=A0AAU9J0K1_9CILI|nr:unnamed protein product [Blepharisma stoltei]
MFDLYNALHTMPSGEHLTARKATKMRFIQLESEQLRSYVEDLESSLAIYKQVLKELLFSKPGTEKSVCDEAETQSVISPRIIETLIAEKRALEERVRRITIERNDAMHKARTSEQTANCAQAREEKIIGDYEAQYAECLAESETKELQIADLEKKNNVLEKDVEQFNINKENQLTIQDQKGLLYKKIEIMVGIVKKMKEKYIKINKENEDLANQCKLLLADHTRGNDLLREKQREFSLSDIIVSPKKDITFNDFFCNPNHQERSIEINYENLEKQKKASWKNNNYEYSPSQKRMAELQNKISKLQDQRDEYTLKINTISQEVQKAKRLQSVLLYDQKNIQKSIDKNKIIEQSLDNQLKQMTIPRTSIQSKSSNETPLIRHCYATSNPLDYAQISEIQKAANASDSPELFSKDFYETNANDVSIIQNKYVEDEMLADSVLLDCLKF